MKLLFALLILAFLPALAFAQCAAYPPYGDQNWQLDCALSDEFNGLQVDQTKWMIESGAPVYGGRTNSFNINPPYISIQPGGTGNVLDLHASWDSKNNIFTTGGIRSVINNSTGLGYYGYGYYEISAQLPGWYNGGSPASGSFEPTFWMNYNYGQNIGNCLSELHNEIDVFDDANYGGTEIESGAPSDLPNYNGYTNMGYLPAAAYYNYPAIGPSGPSIFNTFNKIAVETGPNNTVFYFNGTPYGGIFNDPACAWVGTIGANGVGGPMQVFLELSTLDYNKTSWYNSANNNDFLIDYFHYWTLNLDCSHDITFILNADVHSFGSPILNPWEVKRNITFGNTFNSIDLTSADNYQGYTSFYYRAVNTITVNGEFTVPLGTTLCLLPTPCAP